MMPRWILSGLVALVVVILGNFFYESVAVKQFQCDGDVPEWMIPGDFDGGCLEVRPSWEGILPWNAGRTDRVCIGLGCMDPEQRQDVDGR